MSLYKSGQNFLIKSLKDRYSYNFTFKGIPIIQYPQDLIALQMITWSIKPDLIIDIGIAKGGSLLYHASNLHLLKRSLKSKKKFKVLGVELCLRKKNKQNIIKDDLFEYIDIIEGGSTSEETKLKVKNYSKNFKKIMVILDSNHTHDHVLHELEFYSKLVSKNSYCIVLDTIIEILPKNYYKNRPWDKGNNPYTAVTQFLKKNKNFIVDKKIEQNLIITAGIKGYLKKVRK